MLPELSTKVAGEPSNRGKVRSWIWSVAFSSNGTIIGSGGNDGMVKLSDTQTGSCFNTLKSESPYEGMNITNAKGLTETQRTALKALSAIDAII